MKVMTKLFARFIYFILEAAFPGIKAYLCFLIQSLSVSQASSVISMASCIKTCRISLYKLQEYKHLLNILSYDSETLLIRY